MKFEILKELVTTINKNKVKNIEIIGNETTSSSRVHQLYNLIHEGKVHSEEEAVRILYNTTNVQDPRYKKVRYQMMRRLLHTGLFIDSESSKFTERQKAYYQCLTDYAAASTLIFRSANQSANWFLKKTLKISLDYEFTDLIVNITKLLFNSYKLTNLKSYERYFRLHREYVEMQKREEESTAGHNAVILKYVSTLSPNREVHELAQHFLDQLLPIRQKKNTVQFQYSLFQIEILLNDTVSTLEICDRALYFMDNHKNSNQGGKALVAIQKLVCQTSLRMFEKKDGFATFQYCLENTEVGTNNWFRSLEYYFHHCIHAKRYDEAWQTFKTGCQHPNYEKLKGTTRDNWHLYEGYCHLLAQFDKMDQKEVTELTGPFKFSRFINNFDVLDQDKTAMNIPLIILPVAYSIAAGTYQEQYFSIEGLEKYKRRHLTKELNLRSILFLKLLTILVSNPFEDPHADIKLKRYLNQLRNETIQISRQVVAVEIIPYEDLWEMLT